MLFVPIAKRSLTDITINEIFRSDVNFFLKINNLVEQAKKHGIDLYKDDNQTEVYKAFNSVLIEPANDLGDTLDFSQGTIKERIRVGYEIAEEAFKDDPLMSLLSLIFGMNFTRIVRKFFRPVRNRLAN